MLKTYREDELIQNRAPVLLHGGSEAERRAWAEEAAAAFPTEGPLREAKGPQDLAAALASSRGVVYVPDLGALGDAGQRVLMACLLKEERPKLVLGLSIQPTTALDRGLLRDDLSYRLQISRVDLTSPGLAEAIRSRRAKRKASAPAAPPAKKGGPVKKPAARRK